MNRDEAVQAATLASTSTGQPVDIWEHIGGKTPKGVILPSGRFIAVPASDDPPRWAWRKVQTIEPAKEPAKPAAKHATRRAKARRKATR